MKKFSVLVEETLARSIVVLAESDEQADEIVQLAYKNQDIVLTADDFTGELVLGGEYTDEIKDDSEPEFTPDYLSK